MASLNYTLATPTTSSSPFFSQTTTKQRWLKTHGKQTHRFQVSCNVSSNDHKKALPTNPQPQKLILPQTSLDLQNVDRRNLLLGLGGVYSSVSLSGLPPAFAEAIKAPFNQPDRPCKDAVSGFDSINKKLLRPIDCCPLSKNGPESDFKFPDESSQTRIRYPLHKLPLGYLDKYMDAIQKMRDLPDSDPRSFNNQAKVHCAYCNGSYTQNDKELQIHNSWLFFPFHRWYLYFYERILGDLIGDPTFGLPYWNWDNPEGMTIPHFFVEKQCNNYKVENGENPLYDVYRDKSHIRYEMIDLDYSGKNRDLCYDQKEINLATMNRQMMRNAFDATSFFGGKYVAGDEPIPRGDNVVGSVEAGCHTAVHRWVGNPDPNGNKEDMGNFYSAGYDPLFYVHHSNVDRMWTLWKEMGGKEPTDKDWEDASYVFYDEKQNPVRVYNKQSVDLNKLKYEYASSATPWTDRPPRSRCNRPDYPKRKNTKVFPDQKDLPGTLTLTDTVRLRVKRPPASKNRNAEQKKREKEILCIIGINFDCTESAKFDVFVNDCDEEQITPCDSENVGSFAAVPHAKGMAMGCKSGMRFSLTELLEETGAEGDEFIRVTIVPRPTPGKKVKVTIDAIEIRLIPVLEK